MSLWCKMVSVLLVDALLLAYLPAGVLQIALAVSPDTQVVTEITTNPNNIVVLRDSGIIKSKFIGKSGKLIVHIQDAHCNYEAQSNIANIIESLVKNNSLSFVSVEGADGLIDTSWFKSFPDTEVRKEVASYFMKKGEITGPEFLSITTDYPIKLFGAETREYYIQNLNAFTASYPLKAETEKYLNQLKAALNKLKSIIYNPELKLMDAKIRDHETLAIQFNEYVRFLQAEAEKHKINLRQYDNLFKLINVLIYEKKIDFNVTDKERGALIDEMSKIISKDALTDLVNKSIAFKLGKISSADYYDYIKSLAVKSEIELSSKYPNLYNYIIYNSVYSKINNEKLFGDIKELETAIKEKLFENEDQRSLEKLSRYIDTLLGLINIKLINDEFEYYKTHKDEFATEIFGNFIKAKSIQFGLAYQIDPPSGAVSGSISKIEDFYSIAIKRDKALVDNTLEGMTRSGQNLAVLVTGGFHSEGMAKLLEKQDVSYVVVCPNITKDVETPYIQILTNQRVSFEDILVGAKEPAKSSMLAPALMSWALGLTPDEFNRVSRDIANLSDRIAETKDAWIREHLQLWLSRALQYVGAHRMAHDKNVLMDAYKMAMERSAEAAGLSESDMKTAVNSIIASPAFKAAFDTVYDSLYSTTVGAVDAIRIERPGIAPQALPVSVQENVSRDGSVYGSHVKEDAAQLQQTLLSLGVDAERTGKKVLLVYDTALDPQVETSHVIRAGEVAINKYLNGAIIEIRGTGKALLDRVRTESANLSKGDAVVTIAGDATLNEIGQDNLKDLGKVINVMNPDNRYVPLIGLYDLALRIAYDLGDDRILECLNRIGIKDPNDPTLFTMDDVRKGVIRLLPKIKPVNMAEVIEAYKAAQAALTSL